MMLLLALVGVMSIAWGVLAWWLERSAEARRLGMAASVQEIARWN